MNFLIPSELRTLIDTQPGCGGCKDLASNYLYADQTFTSLVGLRHKEDIVGMTDLDMPCDTVECAHLFRAQDREVIESGENLRILDVQRFADKQWKSLIFTKTPLRDTAQNIVGTVFHGQELHTRELLELAALLSEICYRPHDTSWLTTPTSYTIGRPGRGPKLSPRQEEVLFLLLRGRTARQIARVLGVATRTVEWHHTTLKEKFSAQNKSELVDRAIELGYLNNLPPGLWQRPLSIILRET
ncbi:PAS and helix-turn-helix domain-containing protein [Paludibacterium purpuratum]|uniref:PAS domain-containing protein n=1 Tax=Paludibacterium purpuratum TaxID=1144873 RepID=A0A4R7B1X6_9NEIS|nr:PAS and helix-turn-helix domain-containing protein [Paludibacterium purpuratum]TDR73621.1 PAS domain-containing protein [Paludibacterium purpuratum]